MHELTKKDDERRLRAIINQLVPDSIKRSRIYNAYTEPWRTYHGAHHIVSMFDLFEQIYTPWADRPAIKLMILYHYVWYKVGRDQGLNERMSAQWATADIRYFAPHMVDIVSQGILATEKHSLDDVQNATGYKNNIALFLSLDLWGLGQDWENFTRDTEAIWSEYQPVATREEFDAGRQKWAQDFLKRSRIYPGYVFTNREEQARSNLQRLAEG